MMDHKGKKKMSPLEQAAKMHVMKGIRDFAADKMGENLGSVKKVSVAAPDRQGLELGLEKAKQMIEGGKADKYDARAEGQKDLKHHLSEGPDHAGHEPEAFEGMETPAEEEMEDAEGAPHPGMHGLSEAHEEVDPADEMSPEELDEMIARLMALKAAKQK